LRATKSSAEWPQWRGPGRDGISPDSGLIQDWTGQQPKLLWTVDGMGSGYASVSVAGRRIFTTGHFPTGPAVVCLNDADGQVLCTPGADDAMIVALDKLTGKEIWRAKMPSLGAKGGDGAAYSSIVVSNACGVKQYVQLVGRGVIGVRASDGKFLWDYNGVANG